MCEKERDTESLRHTKTRSLQKVSRMKVRVR